MSIHHKEVCEYGFVHSQCRCPGPKQERPVVCTDLENHAPSLSSIPDASVGALVSLKHSSLDMMMPQLAASNLMLSYASRRSLARAASHLLDCGHEHTFMVVHENRPLPALMTSRDGIDCLRIARLMFD